MNIARKSRIEARTSPSQSRISRNSPQHLQAATALLGGSNLENMLIGTSYGGPESPTEAKAVGCLGMGGGKGKGKVDGSGFFLPSFGKTDRGENPNPKPKKPKKPCPE